MLELWGDVIGAGKRVGLRLKDHLYEGCGMWGSARWPVVLCCAGVFWAAGLVGWLGAQGRFRKMPAVEPRLPELQLEGTVEDVGPGVLRVRSQAGQTWVLRLIPDAIVQVTGKATAEFLSAGQCIALIADVDTRRNRIEAPVTRLTIFNPDPERPLGAAPSQGFGGVLEGGSGQGKKRGEGMKVPFGPMGPFGPGPGLGPGMGPGLGPAEGSQPGWEPPARGARRGSSGSTAGGKGGPLVQRLEVRGRISSIKAGKVALHVPSFKSTLKLEIAKEAEIDVDLTSPSAVGLAQKGDRILARGRQVGEHAGQVNEVEITLSQPLGAGPAGKRGPAARERTGRSRGARESEAKPDFPGHQDEAVGQPEPKAPGQSAALPGGEQSEPPPQDEAFPQ